ncbi:MAG TPA: hypothetical protein ENN87_11605, partial [Phycisphaerales bacterium]|nr:hypothetical protein [Phycisphaerales bacterium]
MTHLAHRTHLYSFTLFALLLSGLAAIVAAERLTADITGDNAVDLQDLRALAEDWLDPACEIPGCPADLDGQNGVDLADLGLLAEQWDRRAQSLVISEFMASNGSKEPLEAGELLDEDGDSSDWIEIHNTAEVPIELGGWYLTIDPDEPAGWRFPDGVSLEPGAFLVVFASGKNRATAGAELHTDFRLNADNPHYLALVYPDGHTIAHDYEPTFPDQLSDISYGLHQYSRSLVATGQPVAYRVPSEADAGLDWTSYDYSDATWPRSTAALGFGLGAEPMVAYNDCIWREDQYIGDHVTTYGIGSAFPGLTSGPLVDHNTGQEMPVTVTFTQTGDVNWQPDAANGGHDCAPGTDAYNTFHGITDMTGVIYYGNVGWTIDLTFSGLDPMTEYTFATSAARCNYDDRNTIYTLLGTDSYANASTPGVDVLADNRVRFNTGDNYEEGYVARWSGIRAADGAFTVRAEADPGSPEGRKAYSFDVFMLQGGIRGSALQDEMLGVNASLWSRQAFELDAGERDLFNTLTLRVRYEDGFVAYLNGVEIARDNAPAIAAWNAHAPSDRPEEQALDWVSLDVSDYLHLLREGTNVLAVHGLNDAAADGDFLLQAELLAASGLGVPQYFTQPTPGAFNVSGAVGLVGDTKFNIDRGFFENPFQVEITTDTEGATIRYTTDGSAPSETHGQIYDPAQPVIISTTTTLRALAHKPGWIPSNVDTQTYIFLNDVIQQPASPPGFPSSWGSAAADYAMNPTHVSAHADTIVSDLRSLPTMSLVMDRDDLFGPSGIYSNPRNSGTVWERPGSIELILSDGST